MFCTPFAVSASAVAGLFSHGQSNTFLRLFGKRFAPGQIALGPALAQRMAQIVHLLFEQAAAIAHPEVHMQTHSLPQAEVSVQSLGDQAACLFTGKHQCRPINLQPSCRT